MLKLDDGKTIRRELPLDKPIEIDVTYPQSGLLGYACSMDMSKGTIVVQSQAAKCKHMGSGAPGFAALGEQFRLIVCVE